MCFYEDPMRNLKHSQKFFVGFLASCFVCLFVVGFCCCFVWVILVLLFCLFGFVVFFFSDSPSVDQI